MFITKCGMNIFFPEKERSTTVTAVWQLHWHSECVNDYYYGERNERRYKILSSVRQMWKWYDHHVMSIENPVGNSDVFFVPHSWHVDHIIFTFVSPRLTFTIFHFGDIDIADPSSMQDACQIWTQYMALLSMSSP